MNRITGRKALEWRGDQEKLGIGEDDGSQEGLAYHEDKALNGVPRKNFAPIFFARDFSHSAEETPRVK